MSFPAAPGPPASPGAPRFVTGVFLAVLGSLLFASKAVVVKLAYAPALIPWGDGRLPMPSDGASPRGVEPIVLLALRMAVALPIYLLIGLVEIRRRHRAGLALPGRGAVLRIALAGSAGYYLASWFDFSGLMYITAQLERLILFTYPIFVVVLGALFFGNRLTLIHAVGMAVSYAGLLLVFLVGETSSGSDVLTGSLLVLAAAFAFAVYQLFAKPLMLPIGSRLFTCLAMGGAAACVLTHFLLDQWTGDVPVASRLTPHSVELGVVLAVFCTVLPSFFMTSAIYRVGPQLVAVIGTLSPVATALLAVWILREPFGLHDAAGALLVVLGVAVYTLRDWAPRRPADGPANSALHGATTG